MKIREMDIEFYKGFYSKNKRKVRDKKTKKEKVLIRHIKESEVDIVKNLIYRTIDSCYSGVYEAASIKYFKEQQCQQRILKDAERGHVIVLVRKRQVIGTGTLLYNTIKRVFIEPQMQRCGFGKMIMQRLELYALSDDIRLVKLHASLPSVKFYQSIRYELVEQAYVEVGNNEKLYYYKMKKELKETLRMLQWISLWIR